MLPPSGRSLDSGFGAKARHLFDRPSAPSYSAVRLESGHPDVRSGSGWARGSAGEISDGRRSFLMVPAQPWHLTCLTGYGHSFMAKRSFGEILKSEREIREVTLKEVTVGPGI